MGQRKLDLSFFFFFNGTKKKSLPSQYFVNIVKHKRELFYHFSLVFQVFIHSFDRWVHCDPCENAFDQPLMYELGWKKKLSYILAFSCDDVQDVSWRYSTRHAEMRARRKSCTESQLLDLIIELRQKRQENLSPARYAISLVLRQEIMQSFYSGI